MLKCWVFYSDGRIRAVAEYERHSDALSFARSNVVKGEFFLVSHPATTLDELIVRHPGAFAQATLDEAAARLLNLDVSLRAARGYGRIASPVNA